MTVLEQAEGTVNRCLDRIADGKNTGKLRVNGNENTILKLQTFGHPNAHPHQIGCSAQLDISSADGCRNAAGVKETQFFRLVGHDIHLPRELQKGFGQAAANFLQQGCGAANHQFRLLIFSDLHAGDLHRSRRIQVRIPQHSGMAFGQLSGALGIHQHTA